MRCFLYGIVWGIFFFLCSHISAQSEIQDHCTYAIVYKHGKPDKVTMEAVRVVIPMIDGIPVYDQRKEYHCTQ